METAVSKAKCGNNKHGPRREMAVGDGEEGKRLGDLSDNPLLSHLVFVKMEDLMDKLKLLDYEQGFCKKLKFKPFSRYV